MDSKVNVDARTALGVRPGARPTPRQLPQIETLLPNPHDSRPPSPHNNHVSITVPGFHAIDRNISATSASTSASHGYGESVETTPKPKLLRRATLSGRRFQAAALTNNRGLYETQKLLAHLLERLENRRRGPDILDRAVIAARLATGTRAKAKRRVAQLGEAVVAAARVGNPGPSVNGLNGEALDEDLILNEDDWDTDATYDMLEQMRDLLNLAERQGLDLFGASQIEAAEAARASSKKKRMGRLSTVAGPMGKGLTKDEDITLGPTVSGPTLLNRLSELVRSLITTDCIYLIHRFGPLRPPYALHSMCLDVAALLYHKGDLKVKLEMMDAGILALYTMGDVMRERICKWLEGRLSELLRRLAAERGDGHQESESVEWNDPFSSPISPATSDPISPAIPTFAFSVAPGDVKSTPEKQHPGWMRFSPVSATFPSRHKISGILSTHSTAGMITEPALRIAALVPRLLVALTSTIDLTTANLMTIHGVHRLTSLILTAKPDAGQDLLEIVAHGPPSTRRRGMDFLATFFPQAVGHNVIARRPALATYQAHLAKWESGLERTLAEDDTENHYYIPWQADSSTDYCISCQQPCAGFSVRCTLCNGVKHLSCLRLLGDEVFEYDNVVLKSGPGEAATVEKVHVRFSLAVPRLDEKVLDPRGRSTDATQRKAGLHILKLVNLFTLTLCAECREPLWGATSQAYACMGPCQRFFHPKCAHTMSETNASTCRPGRDTFVNRTVKEGSERRRDPFTTTSAEALKSFQKAKGRLYRDPEELADMSFDEIALLYANLWNQREICINGVSAGTLRLADDTGEIDLAGMSELLLEYEKVLEKDHPFSPALVDYAQVANEPLDNWHLLWRPRYLQFCSALLRAPPDPAFERPPAPPSPPRLLTVHSAPPSPNPSDSFVPADPPSHAYEELTMETIRQVLASDLSVRDDLAASILIEQMKHFGLCSVSHCLVVGCADIHNTDLNVGFALPLLMDSSPAVELLVLVIEQLLDDIDLTANEQALSLLFNRAWPSSMCSPYAMERLGAAVMSWIMVEDDVLHFIVKNFASKSKRPPGVRHTPSSAAKGTTAVASYKEDRRRLRQRYARPWLEALYRQDPDAYASLAYERSKMIDNRYEVVELAKGEGAASQMAGIALERITSFVDAEVMFEASLDLLTAWLEDLGGIAHNDTAYKSLPRLLRYANTNGDSESMDLWELALLTNADGPAGWHRVSRWLRVLATSGVDVPWSIIKSTVDTALAGGAQDEVLFDLVVAIDTNVAPVDGDELASLSNRTFEALAKIVGRRQEPPSQEFIQVIRTSMLGILKAYGAVSDYVAMTSLHSGGDIVKTLPPQSRRKQSATLAKIILLPLSADAVRAAAGILQNPQFPAEMVLDFLWILFVRSPGAENPDGFLHKNDMGDVLYAVIWPLYSRTVHRQSRARVFLKLMTINPIPIKNLVTASIDVEPAITRERLLTFALELADNRVTYEVNGWRRSAVHLIMLLFRSALQPSDPTPETLVIWNALLPTQLRAMSLCFEEYIVSCSDEQRLKFLARLMRLRSYVPTWPIIGWHILEELVTEQVTSIEQLVNVDSQQALDALSDARANRASILALGLNMLAAGVDCDWMILQRFQRHVSAAATLPWPDPSNTITDILLPALKTMLDSTARVVIKEGGNREKERSESSIPVQGQRSTLVGSLFVPVVINYANVLLKHNFVIQRHILDILMVVFFKHHVEPLELAALSTLQVLAQYAADEKCAENRVLALQILQIAQSHMGKDRFTRVLPRLFVSIADIIMEESTSPDGDPAVVDTGRVFLQESMSEFGKAGLFLQVLYMDGEQNDSQRAPDAIGRAMQIANRDDVAKGKARNVWLDQVILDLHELLRWGRQKIGLVMKSLSNLTKTLEHELSEESSIEFGSFLTKLAKQASESYSPADFDPNPVLQTSRAMLKLCPSSTAVPLFHQISTFLHFALSRFSVNLDQITALVPLSVRIARQHQTPNTIESVIFEACGEATNGAPVTPTTLNSLLAFLARNTDSNVQEARLNVLVEASPGCASVLFRTHPTITSVHGNPEVTMGLLNSAAEVVVRAEMESKGTLGRVLLTLPKGAAVNQLETASHILYASLDVRMGPSRHNLVTLYPVFARSTSLALFASADLLAVHDPSNDGAHLSSAAFIVMRLAILAMYEPTPYGLTPKEAGMPPTAAAHAHDALLSYFRRIWPEWDRLLGLSLAPTCVNVPLRAVVLSMLLDIILFVSATHPNLLTEPAPSLARGLHLIEEWHASHGTNPSPKLAKAAAALNRSALRSRPAADAGLSAKTIIWADMLATERLTALRVGLETRAPTRHAYRKE